MDAQAYLRKQGWRGQGHSLDYAGKGIKKPLLVSKKVDVLGVGLNKHTAISDQWWLRAFDAGLKSFGTGKESALVSVQKHGVNRGGLYTRFVKGEGVPGTFELAQLGASGQKPITNTESARPPKRKRNASQSSAISTQLHPRSHSDDIHSEKSTQATQSESATIQKARLRNETRRARRITTSKLAKYQERAKEKNMSLEAYMNRRKEKFAAKHGSLATEPG